MQDAVSEARIERVYHVSWYIIAYKFLFGLAELLFGLAIVFFGRQGVHWYRTVAAAELAEDPHDLVVRFTMGIVPGIFMHNTALALYLILLGGAKIAGAVGLVYRKNWGVDLLVGLTFFMFPFQAVRFLMHPSLPDMLYIVVGLLIALYLINFRPREWAGKQLRLLRKGS